MNGRERLQEARRIVVKVGTSTLAHRTGKLNLYRIEQLVREIVDIANAGKEVVFVSSGAQAAGMAQLGLRQKPEDIPVRQVLAAIGQGVLMHTYEKIFAEYGQTVGQVLLTKENAVRHNQYHHSREALQAMLAMGIIPVVNENDAVSVDEIKIGDNDNLAAIVATLVDADALIILSDIEGLYTANPATHPEAELIHEVSDITPAVEQLAGSAGSSIGTGGMYTKIEAAKIATSAGVTMAIAKGSRAHVLRELLTGELVGTVFAAKEAHLKVRKSWLAFGKDLRGDICVDEGCERAMRERGSSLLAAGITACEGDFSAGNTVRVLSAQRQEIARGIVNYDKETLTKIMGHQTEDFARLLGDRPQGEVKEEVIHRDNMVLMV